MCDWGKASLYFPCFYSPTRQKAQHPWMGYCVKFRSGPCGWQEWDFNSFKGQARGGDGKARFYTGTFSVFANWPLCSWALRAVTAVTREGDMTSIEEATFMNLSLRISCFPPLAWGPHRKHLYGHIYSHTLNSLCVACPHISFTNLITRLQILFILRLYY